MTAATVAGVREVVSRAGMFSAPDDIRVARLRGVQSLNNSIWTVMNALSGERYVVRIANPDAVTHLGVRRSEEFAAARSAAAVGVGPGVLYFDPESGDMVTPLIESGPSWDARDFRDPGRMSRLVELMRRMHAVTDLPGDDFSVFRRVERLLDGAFDLGLETPPRLGEHRRRLADIESERIADIRRLPGLNHNDLWANNLLDDGVRLLLIDWEFAGLGDGLYDLATASLAGEYGPSEDARLLGQYGLDSPGDLAALLSMKWVARFFEASWALMMHGRSAVQNVGTAQFDYLEHSQRMFTALSDS